MFQSTRRSGQGRQQAIYEEGRSSVLRGMLVYEYCTLPLLNDTPSIHQPFVTFIPFEALIRKYLKYCQSALRKLPKCYHCLFYSSSFNRPTYYVTQSTTRKDKIHNKFSHLPSPKSTLIGNTPAFSSASKRSQGNHSPTQS